jgi:hypothetical protein
MKTVLIADPSCHPACRSVMPGSSGAGRCALPSPHLVYDNHRDLRVRYFNLVSWHHQYHGLPALLAQQPPVDTDLLVVQLDQLQLRRE